MPARLPARDRTAWILAQRPARPAEPDPGVPRGVFLEEERLASGRIAPTAVVLLTNRECPWRCLMCDLWKETTTRPVPPGAIPRQLDVAAQTWGPGGIRPAQVKLYNHGSFFDAAAIPPADYPAIAERLAFADNVVVESHPRLVGERALRLRDRLAGSLEVAMGLETAHPAVLERLNKRFDLSHFERASRYLTRERMNLRAFILVKPPFMTEDEGLEWAVRSAAFAFACGAGAVSLIPTRAGNGAMEQLQAAGEFSPPKLSTLEEAQRAVLAMNRGRVFADTWGLEPFSTCPRCFEARRRRLQSVNRMQRDEPPVDCPECGGA
jgi:archaeosine synthase beta-subunit